MQEERTDEEDKNEGPKQNNCETKSGMEALENFTHIDKISQNAGLFRTETNIWYFELLKRNETNARFS